MKDTEILTSIRKIVRSVNLESKRFEKEYGISIPQLLCLNYLNEQEDFRASHKAIKEFLQLNASTVTGIISRLEGKGLLARLPSQSDRRVGYITLTAKGASLLQDMPSPLHDRLSSKLEKLSAEKLEELRLAFDVIIDFLSLQNLEASPIITATPELLRPENE